MDFLAILGALRDIVIILLGIVWIVAGLLVAAIAWFAWRFTRSLPRRAEAVITPAQEMIGQAKQALGTATEGARTGKEAVGFVSDKAVMPAIMTASAVAGVRRFVQVLVSGPERNGREV